MVSPPQPVGLRQPFQYGTDAGALSSHARADVRIAVQPQRPRRVQADFGDQVGALGDVPAGSAG
jgi:hypothetical protein